MLTENEFDSDFHLHKQKFVFVSGDLMTSKETEYY